MSNSALNNPGTAVTADAESRDPVADALKLIEQTQAAIAKVRAQIDDSTRMLHELVKSSNVFDAVGDRLVNATFKASGEATRGTPSHAVLLSFVEELGELARLALGGARDVRREVRARTNGSSAPITVFHETDTALRELAAALQRIAQRPTRPASPSTNAIEIENRSVAATPPRIPSALDRVLTAGIFSPAGSGSKSGGYKN